MDPNFGGKIFLIQMFFSTILMNSIMTYESTLGGILAIRKKKKNWLWWKEPRQSTHWIQVEANIWHTT